MKSSKWKGTQRRRAGHLDVEGRGKERTAAKRKVNEAKTSTKTWVITVHETHVPIPEEVQGPGQEHKNSFLATFSRYLLKVMDQLEGLK